MNYMYIIVNEPRVH